MPHDHDPLEEGPALRVRALEELMVAKGLVKPETLDSIVEYYERETGPRNGAAVVARAWTDPEYKDWLLRDGTAAINAMGFSGFQGEHIRVVENTDAVHNVIVCTLCSCYPWPVLGLPPTWYKSPAYRSRVVREPRAVLAEFGVSLPDEVQIKVWDSTAEIRYLVLPRRPDGTEGLSTAELADRVTRNGMIGTALV
ncbi:MULTISPECIES: nitrile hydratase subunit alpha [unclassified Ruegeria]|uniref:nitrile hydratase subunit alpha n=1 Tax=unclassified Ruegeria TaxID=2625375 RepID=UPI001ADB70AA|nr:MULTISPECIES: nitrile hydratase subunit alpha [unclassified Ruegeria]MBO9413492.1 nitrile hydratase subunit alpha [Ruegeria sp. R8_1]MBO9417325.1 nitrile hydratase subunit alpha [Ruegeria sp. R8_2]